MGYAVGLCPVHPGGQRQHDAIDMLSSSPGRPRSPSSPRRHHAGDKRTPHPSEAADDANKRPRTLEHHHTNHKPPKDVVCRIAFWLLTPVDLDDEQAAVDMRDKVRRIANLSRVNKQWHHYLGPTLDEACALCARLYVRERYDSASFDIDGPSTDAPVQHMPLAFADMDMHRLTREVTPMLKNLLTPGQPRFLTAIVIRSFLKAAAELAQAPGLEQDDKTYLERLPLTILARSFQRGLPTEPKRFDDIVALLAAHWPRFPVDVQVLLKEDLNAIYLNDRHRRQEIDTAWKEGTTVDAKESARARRKRIQALNTASEADIKGSRLNALASAKASPCGFPSSPSYILTLSWIARHWAALPCPNRHAAQRQDELEQAIFDLFTEVARDIEPLTECSHADFLFTAFPAPLRQVVLQRMKESHRKKLLCGLPRNLLPEETAAKGAC